MDSKAHTLPQEEQTYTVGGMIFIVTPVFQQQGETLGTILLRLMLESLKKP